MSELDLRIGMMDYEHTRALADGTARIDGARTSVTGADIVTEIFRDMMTHQAYDVSELGMTYYLRTLESDDPPFIAIPVFPNRIFRHSAIYINTSSGITGPQDLSGRTIGEFALWSHDAGFWPKGILVDEYGVDLAANRWIVGGFDWPMPPLDFVPQPHPAGIDVRHAPDGKALGPMLEAGEIDALISADVPQCVLDRSPAVAQLFPDSKAVEQDYYRRTGIFPIMHTVVVRRRLLARHPGLAQAVYRGFCEAKDVAMRAYRHSRVFNNMTTMLPWASQLHDEDRSLLGEDYWPYGVAANRAAIDTALRYNFEQGVTRRLLTAEEFFVPELLDT